MCFRLPWVALVAPAPLRFSQSWPLHLSGSRWQPALLTLPGSANAAHLHRTAGEASWSCLGCSRRH